MGFFQPDQDNFYVLLGITLISAIVLHFIYKLLIGSKKIEAELPQIDSDADVISGEAVETNEATEKLPSGKSKKRTAWKGKMDFSHPSLLKNLKGHPGTVMHMDLSANGKFMAAVCDEVAASVDGVDATPRRRKPREKRRLSAPPRFLSPQRISAKELAPALRAHLLTPERMWALGYPLEIEPSSTKAIVYINPPPRVKLPIYTEWDVNAPEFIPGGSQSDSGRGSWGSTPRSDSDEEADAVEHCCARCDKMFRMTREGEYLQEESCIYHWGRLNSNNLFVCCNSVQGSRGCSTARFHVWSGTRPGMNGPVDGYVRAKSPRGGVFAIDAEMCYTTAGLELASIAVVGVDGKLVYRSFVKPSSPVVDCNTRFSGIKPRDLARFTKSLREVQNDILGFVGTDTILIGHALDNDLRALKLLHKSVVDTCDLYPHPRGFPFRRSLRALSEEVLGRHLNRGGSGHSPLEDARVAMDLVLLKVQEERAKSSSFLIEPYDLLLTIT